MKPTEVLKTYFGYDTFRRGQEEIIEAILRGRDALAIMPTGAGKSVCYQVPALMLPGITLVVSPLISLMQDQVKALNDAGIHAAFINSARQKGRFERPFRWRPRVYIRLSTWHRSGWKAGNFRTLRPIQRFPW